MTAFKSILVPTDFGEAANQAIDVAMILATKFESKLTLLHAYTIPYPSYGYGDGLLWPVDDLSRAAKKELDDTLRKTKERCPKIEGVLVCGEPWDQILETAKSCGADLIVMGTHGRRGFSRVFLGSVAEKVVRLSPIPVLTVSSKEDQKAKEKVVAESGTATRR